MGARERLLARVAVHIARGGTVETAAVFSQCRVATGTATSEAHAVRMRMCPPAPVILGVQIFDAGAYDPAPLEAIRLTHRHEATDRAGLD